MEETEKRKQFGQDQRVSELGATKPFQFKTTYLNQPGKGDKCCQSAREGQAPLGSVRSRNDPPGTGSPLLQQHSH